MEFDITPILTAIIGLCAAVITYVVVPWIKSKTNEQKQDDLLKWVKLAVAAAEQIYDATQGTVKKKAVIEYIKAQGFVIDESKLDTAIEAAVNELHNKINN